MEGRKDPTGPDIPASPVFSHTAPTYMDDLLQGLVDVGRSSSPGANSQVNFPPWSPYGESDQFQQSAFTGWNSFGPTIDLAGSPGSHLPASSIQGYQEYLQSLASQHDAGSTGNVSGAEGFYRVYSDSPDGLLGGQNLGIAVESGRTLYAEALSQLTNFPGKEYEPFGMTDVFNPPVEAELDIQEAVGPDLNAGTSGSSSKPSYSEVARNNPSGAHHSPQTVGPCKSKQNLTYLPPEDTKFPDFPNPHPHVRIPTKRPKSSSWSHGTHKQPAPGKAVPSPTPVKPNSKMGLDQFDDVSVVQERYRRSLTGDDGSNPRSRKGSTSSIGSGSSGMDDFACFIQNRSGYSYPTREGSPSSGTCDNSSCDGTGSEKLDLSGDVTEASSVKPKAKASRRLSRQRSGSSSAPLQEKINSKSRNTSSSTTDIPSPDDNAKKGIFFDPKRIFGERDPKLTNPKPRPPRTKSPRTSESHIPNNQNQAQSKEKCATNVLNNGKPKSNFMYTTNNHGKPATTHYINNDLRQPAKKMTNTEGRNSPNRGPSKSSNTHRNTESQTEAAVDDSTDAQPDTRPQSPPSPAFSTARRKNEGPGKKSSESRPHGKRVRRQKEHSSMIKGELLEQSWEWCKWAFSEVTHHAINIFLLVLKLTLALLAVALSGVVSGCCRLWSWLRLKIPFLRKAPSAEDSESFDWSNPNTQSRFKSVGLEKNIPLPTTGEEAMKRLLACKGKDPYSILGVRSDSTDEEIKKYYRKQAVLVHPDKNKIPGAEEAFKILGHSFELIGEPEKRSKYDAQRLETQETETAMHEFADLLSKLHNKMQEAANLMRCELCGGKHRRVPTERPWYNARYCDRCNVRHSAKEGDVWAESRVMGFLWHYYACMEGKIYDITEWASCQRGNFKHIQANAHHVIYRIATQAGARQRAQSNSGRGNNEADLEDFINHLFQRAGRSDSNGGDTSQPASGTSASAAPANSAAKKRRKKKKH